MMGLLLPYSSKFSKLIIIDQIMSYCGYADNKEQRQSRRSFNDRLSKQIKMMKTYRKTKSVNGKCSTRDSTSLGLQRKFNYKLSLEYITFLIQEERQNQLECIGKDKNLSNYYECFNNLFKIIYISASTFIKQCFYNQQATLNLDRFQIINIIIGEPQQQWNLNKYDTLLLMAQNIYLLSKTIQDFQKRIEYVSRKVCMNQAKQKCISAAFLNSQSKAFWKRVSQIKSTSQERDILFDMFQTDTEKLCFYDVKKFVNEKLCSVGFKETIQKSCKKEEIDFECNINYTFEFLLLEQFCLSDDCFEIQVRKKPCKRQIDCSIM